MHTFQKLSSKLVRRGESIGIIIIFLYTTICLFNLPAHADATRTFNRFGEAVYVLDEVVVYSEKPLLKPYVVSELSAAKIDNLGADTFADALKSETGLLVLGGRKDSAYLRIRTSTSQQPMILLDGRPLNAGYMGTIDLSLLPVDLIEMVQVIKGPASVAYGANTLGGVVNIITRAKAQEPLKVRLNSRFGSNAYRFLSGGAAGNWNNFHINFSAEEMYRDGYELSSGYQPVVSTTRSGDEIIVEDGGMRDNSDNHRTGLNLKIRHYRPSGAQFSFSASHAWAEKGLPSATYRQEYWRFADWNRSSGTFTVQAPLSEKWLVKGNIYGNLNDDRLIRYYNDSFTGDNVMFYSIIESWTLGSSIETFWQASDKNNLTFGFRGQRDHSDRQPDKGDPWEDYETQTFSLYAQDQYSLNSNTILTTGLGLYGFSRETGSDWLTPVCPMASLSHELQSGYILRLSGSRNVNFPSMHNLYSRDKITGNPGLKPEEAWKVEISGEKEFLMNDYRRLSPELVLFAHFTDNQIDVAYTPGGREFHNLQKIETYGVELNLNGSYSRYFGGGLSVTALTWDRIETPLFHVPKFKLAANLNFRTPFETEINTNWTFFGERNGDNGRGVVTPMPDYLVGNINIEQPIFSWLSLRVDVRNILDRNYEEEYGYPAPGRQIFGGVNLTY